MQSFQGLSLPNHGTTPTQYIDWREDSSSATTSNLPGPSRVMGQLFSWLGVKLERRINLAADRLGYGPLALRRKLTTTKYGFPILRCISTEMTVKERKRMIGKLMEYVSSGKSLTQSQALELICDLILRDRNFAIRDEFLDAGLYAELQNLWLYCDMAQKQYQYLARRDPDIDFLLASSRKALIFVEENEVNTVAKPFVNLNLEIWDKSYSDKLATLSLLLHAYTVLMRQAYRKETRYTPIGTLASAYYVQISSVPLSIIYSFHMGLPRTESLVAPLPTEKIELCIRAHFLSFLLFAATDRILVRHCTFKSLTEERKLRYYSMVQRAPAYYNKDQEFFDFWDDIALPTLPDRYSNVKMELLSVTKILVKFLTLDELRFPLPTGLDRAILLDSSWDVIRTGGFRIDNFLTVWQISSES